MNLQANIKRARAHGLRVIPCKKNELQLDIDSVRSLERYGWQIHMLREAGLARGWRVRVLPSKTAGHVHIIIKLPKVRAVIERVCLQALLGSDLKREMFNFIRAKKGSRLPIALFRR